MAGTWPTIATLAVGLAATVGVVWFALSWTVIISDELRWASWMLVLVQSSLWLSATALCLWQWRQRRTGLWIALAAGAFATGFFVVVVFLLVASLPCP
ncbi:hypothetical protein ACIPEQ_10040 [Curtobacterium sp. NPDC087080]|uniref:hypothetical protein n=1 Tax=Curtobacterium sp. NPDC087080 TaxID=3363965 RepID=UPI0037F324EB